MFVLVSMGPSFRMNMSSLVCRFQGICFIAAAVALTLRILGNHRDAWVFGAADPSSGTAVMLEMAKGLSALRAAGWRNRRTIIMCSWYVPA